MTATLSPRTTGIDLVQSRASFKRVFMVALAVFTVLLMGILPAFAENPRALVDLGENASAGAVAEEINSSTKTQILEYNKGILYFDNTEYAQLDSRGKNNYMRIALGTVRNSDISTVAKNRMFNFIADQDEATSSVVKNLQTDAQADVSTASSWFDATVGRPLSIFLGFVVIVVFVFLSVGLVFDISYIAIPMFRAPMHMGKEDKRPFFLSNEAYSAVEEAENASSDQNSMMLYLKKRFMFIIVVAGILLLLISGQLFSLIGFFIDVLQPFIELFYTGY